jgi:AraC-like DNA-binding protein
MPPARTVHNHSSSPLPPLAFGARISSFTTDPLAAAERSASALTCLRAFEPAQDSRGFAFRAADIRVGELTMVANSASGMTTKADGAAGFVFMLSLDGNCTTRDSSGRYALRADSDAILLKNDGPRETFSDMRSLFIAKLNAERLNRTIAGMFGDTRVSAGSRPARLDQNFRTRVLPLHHGDFNFSTLFRRTFNLIDSVCDSPQILDALRLDDMIYRNIACLLEPVLLLGAPVMTSASYAAAGRATDIVCDAVRDNPGRMLTLTEMENLSGLSCRALQYAFQKRFRASPMEWQRNEKLIIARDRIVRGESNINITALSYDLGFSKPSSFSAYYRQRFGESPRETRARV